MNEPNPRGSDDSNDPKEQRSGTRPDDGDSPALALLLDELRLIAVAGNYNVHTAIQLEKAKNILEATAGDVLTAAQLYWDDYLATLQQAESPRLEAFAAADFALREENALLVDQRAIAEQSDDDMEDPLMRRRRAQGASVQEVNQVRDMVQALSKFEGSIKKRDSDQLSNDDPMYNNNRMNPEHGNHHEEHPVVGYDRLWQQPRLDRNFLRYYGDESASVSDDEKVVIHRRNSHQYTSHRRLLQHIARTCDPETISVKRRKLKPSSEAEDTHDDDDDYLSDNDWMWESLAATSSSLERSPISAPTAILWGGAAFQDSLLSAAEEEMEVTIVQDGFNKKQGIKSGEVHRLPSSSNQPFALDASSASNMVAADDAAAGGHDGAGSDKIPASKPIGIPRTWMNASFHLVSTPSASSTKVMGLALKAPQEDDLAHPIWKQDLADVNARHPTIPLPYHCRGISALLSVVTGLLYAGVAVQSGGQITCHSSRQPLQELLTNEEHQVKPSTKKKLTKGEEMYQQLSATDRSNREYDARLADTLTALLYVAADASMQRKQKALRDLESSKDPADQRKWQKIQRKLRLVPTCGWDGIPSISDTFQEGELCNIPIATSYTNIEDLRSYVLSNMRAFTSSGGCALFLETIIRIHGKGAVMHMVKQARKKAGYSGKDVSTPLIQCTCRARHFEKLDGDPVLCQALKAQSKKGIIQDTTPSGHSCVSVELLSLLLVGRVHSTWKGWYPKPLGIGILSNTAGEMGRCLARPEKPVWILRGPTCYSVLWLNGCNEHGDTFSRIDRPGSVATMMHWNTWYEERNATQFRLVDRSSTTEGLLPDDEAEFERALERMPLVISRVMARRRRANDMRAQELTKVEMGNPELLVCDEELERVVVHPDDPKFYPGKYHLWRFDLGEDPKTVKAEDRKQRGQVWKSYHTLSDREKLIVETKLGPKICTLLWTRWPRATMDRFVPGGVEPPPIV